MGINSLVRFAAWIPAKRATSSGLPLGFCGKRGKYRIVQLDKSAGNGLTPRRRLGAHVHHVRLSCFVEVRKSLAQ
jgi:hypothetical protein